MRHRIRHLGSVVIHGWPLRLMVSLLKLRKGPRWQKRPEGSQDAVRAVKSWTVERGERGRSGRVCAKAGKHSRQITLQSGSSCLALQTTPLMNIAPVKRRRSNGRPSPEEKRNRHQIVLLDATSGQAWCMQNPGLGSVLGVVVDER